MNQRLRQPKALRIFLFASVFLSLILWVRFWLLEEPEQRLSPGGSARQEMLQELQSSSAGSSRIASVVEERQLRRATQRFHIAWEQQDLVTAEKVLANLQRQYPEHVAVLVDQALFQLLQNGNVRQAAHSFSRLMELSRETGRDASRLLATIIAVFEQAEMWQAGYRFLQQLDELQGGLSAKAQLALGRFLVQDGKYEEAQQALSVILHQTETQPQLVSAQALETQILMRLGEKERAIERFYDTEQALEKSITAKMRQGEDVTLLASEMDGLQFFMAEELVASQSFADAERIVLKLAEKFPAHPSVVRLLDQIRLYKLELGAG